VVKGKCGVGLKEKRQKGEGERGRPQGCRGCTFENTDRDKHHEEKKNNPTQTEERPKGGHLWGEGKNEKGNF